MTAMCHRDVPRMGGGSQAAIPQLSADLGPLPTPTDSGPVLCAQSMPLRPALAR